MLVPPRVTQPFSAELKIVTPTRESASIETSGTERAAQPPATVCHDGSPTMMLQPLPEPDQTLSLQPRGFVESAVRLVPPTAVTNGEEAGNWTCPMPRSPALAVIAIPGWLNAACASASMLGTLPPPSVTPQLLLIATGFCEAA